MPTPHLFALRPDLRLPLAFALVLTALLSLPQVWPLDRVVDHQDPLFSMWRIAWVGHSLVHAPGTLFHANIFHPQAYTLTFSDSVLLQGVSGSVLRGLGLSPPVAYNLLMWLSFPVSALTMFALAEKVSGSAWGALIAALAFALSTNRFDHLMHLELIWTQWIPLQIYCALCAYENGGLGAALALAGSLLLQLLSGLYLFLFAATALVVVVLGLAVSRRLAPIRRVVRTTVIVAVLVGLPATAYARTYAAGLQDIGPRTVDEVETYSARVSNFFSAPSRNVLYGWTEEFWGGAERQFFAGFVVMGLVAVALVKIGRSYRVAMAGLALFAAWMCLGVNGSLYPLFYEWVPAYANLRVPARFATFLSAALAPLAACGLSDLINRATIARTRRALVAATAGMIVLETATLPPLYTRTVPDGPSPVDRVLAATPDSVVVEYPMPRPGWFPAWDAVYEMRSIHHWRPLVNGYSGNYPTSYVDLIDRLDATVPGGAAWMKEIKRTGATHLVVHKGVEKTDIVGAFLFELEKNPDVSPVGDFGCWPDSCRLYRLY